MHLIQACPYAKKSPVTEAFPICHCIAGAIPALRLSLKTTPAPY